VNLTSGGLLHRLAQTSQIQVNSLHHQGIDSLATGLVVDGVAPDGTIECIRATGTAGFALGVQWHPEFDACTNPLSAAIFRAFGNAVHHGSETARLAAD
jgi:putative glutamine amidotransferase